MAANRGRTAIEVHKMWLVDAKGRRITVERREKSAPIPTVVKERNRVHWYVEPRTLGVLTKQGGNPLVVRPVIESGPGVLTRGRKMWIAVADEYLPGQGQQFTPTLAYRLRTWRNGVRDLKRRVRVGEIGQFRFEAFSPTVWTTEPPDAPPPAE